MFLRQIALTTAFASILLIAVSTSEAEQAGTDATTVGSRIFAFLDKNGDKRVTDQEIGLIPVTMKSWLKKQGILKKTGFSRAEFLANSARMLADLRNEQQVTSSPTVLTNKTPPAAEKKSPSSVSPKRLLYAAGAAAELISGEMPVTVSDATANLPSEFQECDLNRDGQIDFYEWRKCKRAEIARFYELDKNRDAVLSLEEINGSDTSAVTESTPGTTKPSAVSKPTKKVSAKTISQSEVLKITSEIFGRMDDNKNNRIDPGEWDKSKRMKPKFAEAGANLKRPMDLKQFSIHYQKIFPEEFQISDDGKEEKRERKDRKRERRRR
ncbi:MAG: hypothetical protein IID45_02985 [Planctomycetes bacterium]|nr:hypothetical protein [Planctomycetota bacterium]